MDSGELIKEFYNKNSIFHFIPYKEFITICNAPFSYLKENMKKGEDTRLKYLGNFSVVPSRIRVNIEILQKAVLKGRMKIEDYKKYLDNLTKVKENEKIKKVIESFDGKVQS